MSFTTSTTLEQTINSASDAAFSTAQSTPPLGNSLSQATGVNDSGTVTAIATSDFAIATSALSGQAGSLTHVIDVALDNRLLFSPNQTQAVVGDVVLFRYYQVNHSVTQSILAEPCKPMLGGFDSGFTHFNPNDRVGEFVAFNVNDLFPRWFFCRQTELRPHCEAGMKFANNPGDQMNAFLDTDRADPSATSGTTSAVQLTSGAQSTLSSSALASTTTSRATLTTVSVSASASTIGNGVPTFLLSPQLSSSATSEVQVGDLSVNTGTGSLQSMSTTTTLLGIQGVAVTISSVIADLTLTTLTTAGTFTTMTNLEAAPFPPGKRSEGSVSLQVSNTSEAACLVMGVVGVLSVVVLWVMMIL